MRIGVFIFSFIFSTSALFAQNIHADLSQIFSRYKLMGMSVVGVCNGKVAFSHYQGLADFQRNIPIDSNTKYRIASISKAITAMALMKLWEQGYFQLDDDVNNYLNFSLRNPNFPTKAITFRMLLSHTASLNDGTGYENFLNATYTNTTPPNLSQLLTPSGSYYTANMFLNREPGTYFSYANVTYGVIGTLIERISGKRFDVFCKENIFQPLGLNASFNIQDLTNINQVAVLYRKSGSSWVPQIDNYNGVMPPPRDLSTYTIGNNGFIFAPQGGLRISAKDLAILALLMINKGIYNNIRILNASTVNVMSEPQWTFNGTNGNNYSCLFNEWTLGLHSITNRTRCDVVLGKKMLGHAGEAYGLISDWYFNASTKEVVVFITNGSETPYATTSQSAFYAVEHDIFQAVKKELDRVCGSSSGSNPPSVTALESNSDFQVFPNPACESIEIQFTQPVSAQIQFYNAQGKLLVEGNSQGKANFNIFTKNLPKGMYLLHIRSTHFQKQVKVVLE